MSGVGHWRYQLADGEVTWSDEVYRIHGVDRQTFNPGYDDAVAFYHPDDRATVTDLMGQAIETKTGFEFQLRLIRGGGECRDVVCKAVCELDPTGAVSAVFGVFQDITAQVRTLKGVQQSERRYRLLADNMSDVVTRIRLDGGSDYISPGIEQLLGYSPGEMTGQTAQAFVHLEDQPLILETFAQMAKGVERMSVQHRAAHKDGHAIWVETGFQLIRNEAGRPVEIVAVIRDITDRKAMEDELRAARIEAEAAAAVKAEFLANMSHELRTPLTAVLGFSRLVEEQPELTPTTRGYLGRVSNAGKALLSTVNDILDFSKLEAGQVEIKPQPMSAAQLASDTIDLFAAQAAEKGLNLKITGLDTLPAFVRADPDRVRQILLNLLGNAVKFTDRGEVSLDTAFDTAGGVLSFRVSDSGLGIPADRLAQLFQRFSQIDGSSTRRHGGTGLGLAICKGLAEAMDGEIGVTSRIGEGSCFWFSVPAAEMLSHDTVDSVEGRRDIPTGIRVLLADDNRINRDLVRAMLTPFNVEITEAIDGLQAVELASEVPFDVILMDLRMPGLDGAGAARRIRTEDGLNATVPIIAFSADATADSAKGLFDGFVAKPLTAASLVNGIAKALDWHEEGSFDAAA
jgi:PAS domain S-box-containing protein